MSSQTRAEQALLIVFADITRFTLNAAHRTDVELADLLDAYYRFAEAEVEQAKGRLVKFMGDAFLAVWAEADASLGAASLCAMKEHVDAFWSKHGWDSKLVVKAHFGRVVAGDFGEPARFDVIGNEVNTTARLPARSVSLSAEAFRRLGPDGRKAFKKHSSPVVYIPSDDPRP